MIYLFTALFAEAAPIIEHYSLKRNKKENRIELYEKEIAVQSAKSVVKTVMCQDAEKTVKTVTCQDTDETAKKKAKEQVPLRLVITGVGAVAAARAVGVCAGLFGFSKNDCILNIGTAASTLPRGTALIGNKLVCRTNGRTFYPDMLMRLPQNAVEGTIYTTGKVVCEGQLVCEEQAAHKEQVPCGKQCAHKDEIAYDALSVHGRLTVENVAFDMEAAAIYEAASAFLGPHQLSFLKIISDAGERSDRAQTDRKQTDCEQIDVEQNDRNRIDVKQIQELIENKMEVISTWIEAQKEILQSDEMASQKENGLQERNRTQNLNRIQGITGNQEKNENQEKNDNQEKNGYHKIKPTDKKIFARKLGEDLHCSVTMRLELEQLLHFAAISGIDTETTVRDFYENGALPARDKRNGKKILDEIRRRVVQ